MSGTRFHMTAGLEKVGIPTAENLRDELTSCTDPLAAIEDFQVQNGILLPSLRPALPFLELHDVSRLDFHMTAMEELRDNLVAKVGELAASDNKNKYKMLNELLEKSFPVIGMKSMRPVVMAVLKHIPRIKPEYLQTVMDGKELYGECATEVKRQIWEDNQALFGDEVSPLLTKYIQEKETMLFTHENATLTFFSPSPKTRRQAEVVEKLVDMVGRNIKLYDMVLQFLRTLFLRTRNVHYCTLRAEILMALHDLEVHEICSIDPCHKFTWCLDACIREKFVDSKRARELQGFLDGVKRGQEQVLGDLSMILCDPYAMNTIALSTMKALQQCILTESLPRDNADLILLLRMLSLGVGAWDMIDSQQFREPKLESVLVVRFLPCIISLMTDDHINNLSLKIPGDSPQQFHNPPDTFKHFIKSDQVAGIVALYYTLQSARLKDHFAVVRVLPSLLMCENDKALDDTFLHCLVSHLTTMVEDFANADFCSTIFDDFFLPSLSRENVLRHMLRLIWHTHHKMPNVRLQSLMIKIEPNNQHSEAVHTVYRALSDKVTSYQPSPTAQPQQIDSPLMSVPAPTPAPL